MISRLPSKNGIRRYNIIDMDRDERRTYNIWKSITNRCHCPTSAAYEYYGGRGIFMSVEFLESFEVFWEHIGAPPSREHSVDRIENDKGYERGNIRWATQFTQCRNRRCNIIVEWRGKSQCLADWSAETGIPRITLYTRWKQGICGDELFKKATNRGRQAIFETINGETKTLTQWALVSGVGVSTLIARYLRGWRGEKLISPARHIDNWWDPKKAAKAAQSA